MAQPSTRTVAQTGCVPPDGDTDLTAWKGRVCCFNIGSMVPEVISTAALQNCSLVESVTICDTAAAGSALNIYLPSLAPHSNGFVKAFVNTGAVHSVNLTGASIVPTTLLPSQSISYMWFANSWFTWNVSVTGEGGVTAVLGTLNQITSSGGATPTLAISPTYAGQTSITELGIVSVGTWQGTPVATAFGGTGLSSVTAYAPLFGGTAPTSPLQSGTTGTAGQVLTSNGASAIATFQTLAASSISVVTANGLAGTVATPTTTPAITLTTTVTGMLKGNGTAISAATPGTDYSAGTAALATGILKSTTGTGALSISVASDFPTLNQNTTGTAALATTVTTNANLTGPVTSVGNATSVTSLAITNAMIANSTIDLTAKVTGVLPVSNGGTGISTVGTSVNALLVSGSTATGAFGEIVAGAGGTILTSNGPNVVPSYQTPVAAASVIGYFYQRVTDVSATIAANNGPALFQLAGTSNTVGAFVFVAGSGNIQVVNAGVYMITYAVAGAESNAFALFINGAIQAGTAYGSGAGTQQNNGFAPLALLANDVVSLRTDNCASAITLQLAGTTDVNQICCSIFFLKVG